MPPDLAQLAAALEAFGHGQRVGGLAMLDERADVLKDHPVIGAVKVLLRDEIGDPVPGRVIEQQPSQHRLLGLDRLGRDPRGLELGVLDDRGDLGLSHAARCRCLAGGCSVPGGNHRADAARCRSNLHKKKGRSQPFFSREKKSL